MEEHGENLLLSGLQGIILLKKIWVYSFKNSLGLWLFKIIFYITQLAGPWDLYAWRKMHGKNCARERQLNSSTLIRQTTQSLCSEPLQAHQVYNLADGLEDSYDHKPVSGSLKHETLWEHQESESTERWEEIKDINSLKETMFLDKCLRQESDCIPCPSVEKLTARQTGGINRPRSDPPPQVLWNFICLFPKLAIWGDSCIIGTIK